MKPNLTKLLVSLGSLTLTVPGHGQIISWSGAGDGSSWNDAANWSGRAVPEAGQDVLLTSDTGGVVVITNDVAVRSLQCSRGLQLTSGSLTLSGGGSLISGPLSVAGPGSLTVNGARARLNVSGLTTARDTSFYAVNGGVLELPTLSAITNAQPVTWLADGAGSRIALAGLTNLACVNDTKVYVLAYDGGTVELSALTRAPVAVAAEARGTGSQIDLSGIFGSWSSQSSLAMALSASDGASVLIPNVTQLGHAQLAIHNTGVVPTAQLNQLTNATLTVDGAAPDFGSLTNIDDTSLRALNGGRAGLTNVRQIVLGAANPTWEANGPGSVVDLSGLTVVAESYYQSVGAQAFDGGTVDLQRLTNAPVGVSVEAQGTGSLVDLSGMAGRWGSWGNERLRLSARTGAKVLIPNVTQLENAQLNIVSNGVINTAQLNLLTNVSLSIEGAAPDFSGITNMDDTSVEVSNGGTVRLANVTQAVIGQNAASWGAIGAGSLLDLSRLTTLMMDYYQQLFVQASAGGKVDLSGLNHAPVAVTASAQDADSVIDLSGVTGRWLSRNRWPVALTAQYGAGLLIPNVTELENGSLRISNNGTLAMAQLSLLTNVTLTVDGAMPDLSNVTNIDDTSISALNSGVAALTNVTAAVTANGNAAWRADGVGSLVDLSRMTRLTFGSYSVPVVAYGGGQVDLHQLSSAEGPLSVSAQGTGSVVDLSAMAGRWRSPGTAPLELSAADGGSVRIPKVTQIENGWLTIKSDGMLPTAQLDLLTNATLAVDGAEPDFGMLTNIDDTRVFARNGGVASLTNVTRIMVYNSDIVFSADGAGSLVNLSALTNLAPGAAQQVWIGAYNSGTVDLRHLGPICRGSFQIYSDGAGSVVDLAGLSGLLGMSGYSSLLAAQNGGSIAVNDQALLLANTRVTNAAVNLPPANTILPPELAATNTLTLCGRPWHSYWMEQRDASGLGSPWRFVMRVPLTNNAQTVNFTPLANTELRVWDFISDPPILDLSISSDLQAQLVLYGATNQTYQVLTTPELSPGLAWELGGTAIMTNAFRIFPASPAVDPARCYRARQL